MKLIQILTEAREIAVREPEMGMERRRPSALAHKKSSLDEYYEAMEQSKLGQIPGFVDQLRRMDDMSRQMLPGSEHIEKSADGNVIVFWKESNKTVFLVGIVAKGDRIGSGAAPALNRWINMLVKKLGEGKVLFTSPHEMTEKVLDKIIERAETDGVELTKKELSSVNFHGIDFKNVAVFNPKALQLAGGTKSLPPAIARFLT